MIYILITFLLNILSAIIHIFIHKILKRLKKNSFVNMSVFLPGLIIVILFPSLPITRILFYILLVIAHSIFYTSPYLGDEGPATRIYFAVMKKEKMKEKEIVGLFTDEELIKKRLRELNKSGQIINKKNSYLILKKGKQLVYFINLYRRLLNWDKGGG